MNLCRQISTFPCLFKEIPNNLKGKSKSSQEWLTRQLKDPYVELAKRHNYRCRSAFKLLEINERHKILHPGQCVVDCGAAPGGWTQVAVEKTNATSKNKQEQQGLVVSIDRLPIFPIEGATILGNNDFTLPSSQQKLLEALKDRKVDVVLSDMAPNATGIKSLDHDSLINLAYTFIRFALQISSIDGTLLVKLWEGNMASTVVNDLKKFYTTVNLVKPPSSRSNSSEIFILAKGFQGIEDKKQ